MGVIKKQAIRGSIYSYLGIIVGFLNTALLMPKLLSPAEIGLVNILVAISAIYAQFSTLGFTNVINRLFPYFRNNKNGHNGFVFITVVVGFVGFALSLITFFILKPVIIRHNVEDSPLLVEYILFLIPLIFFRMFFLLLDNYNKVLYDATTGTFLSDLFYRIGNFFLLVAYFFELIDFAWFVVGYVFFLSFPAIYLAIMLMVKKQFRFTPQLNYVSKPLRKEMISLSVYGIIGGLSGVAVISIDKIMVNQFLDLAYTGIYSISFFFGTILLIPNRAIAKISSTFIAEAWKDNDVEKINDIYYKSSINQLILGLLLFVGIIINLDNIFHILPSEYEMGRWVIIFVSLGNIVSISTGVSVMVLSTSSKYKIQTYLMAFLIVLTVITNLIFIPIWGITGAAVATMISMLLSSSFRVWYIKHKMNLFPYRKSHLTLVVISVICLVIGLIIPDSKNFIIDIIFRSGIVTVLFLGAVYLLKISDEINKSLNKVFAMVIKPRG